MAATSRVERVEARTRNPKWKNHPLRIEMSECINCDACLRHCPTQFGAIFNHGVDVVIIPELCSGCDKCLPACPVDCIYPFPEWEQAGYPQELVGRAAVREPIPTSRSADARHPSRRRRLVDRWSRSGLSRCAVHPRLHGQPDVDATRGRGVRRGRVRGRAAAASGPRHDGRRHAHDVVGRLVGRGRGRLPAASRHERARSSSPGCRWAAR